MSENERTYKGLIMGILLLLALTIADCQKITLFEPDNHRSFTTCLATWEAKYKYLYTKDCVKEEGFIIYKLNKDLSRLVIPIVDNKFIPCVGA